MHVKCKHGPQEAEDGPDELRALPLALQDALAKLREDAKKNGAGEAGTEQEDEGGALRGALRGALGGAEPEEKRGRRGADKRFA